VFTELLPGNALIKSVTLLSPNLHLGLVNGPFPSGLLTKDFVDISYVPMLASRPVHLPFQVPYNAGSLLNASATFSFPKKTVVWRWHVKSGVAVIKKSMSKAELYLCLNTRP
jgi:hypothetical protein